MASEVQDRAGTRGNRITSGETNTFVDNAPSKPAGVAVTRCSERYAAK